ncbi:MAG TPA: CcdC protein domain-containing protein [Caulobacteraceae bacterium]
MSLDQLLPILIPLFIAVPLMLLRNRNARRLHPERLWIIPLLITLLIGSGLYFNAFAETPGRAPVHLDVAAYGIMALGLVLGGLFGWWRGKMTEISRNAAGELYAKASALGIILILAVLVLRRGLNAALASNAAAWHLDAVAITDAFMVFVVGMIIMQRVEMYIRAKRIQAGEPDEATVQIA